MAATRHQTRRASGDVFPFEKIGGNAKKSSSGRKTKAILLRAVGLRNAKSPFVSENSVKRMKSSGKINNNDNLAPRSLWGAREPCTEGQFSAFAGGSSPSPTPVRSSAHTFIALIAGVRRGLSPSAR